MNAFVTRRIINYKWITIIFILNACQRLWALTMTGISVPEMADIKDIVTLTCTYEMGTTKLNSVKFYKEGSEFFRYSPMMFPSIMTFPVDGVHLKSDQSYKCNQNICSVVLDGLVRKSTGSYRCEISGDAPEFHVVHETANMTIAVLPQHDPIITGLSPSYEDGEYLDINCTSDLSYPAPKLVWFINDKEAPPEYLFQHPAGSLDMTDFKISFRNLALRFFVDKSRHQLLPTSSMRLRCLAKIDNFFPAHRESNRIVNIRKSQFDMLNQKLTKQSASGAAAATTTTTTTSQFYSTHLVVTILCLVFVHLPVVARSVAINTATSTAVPVTPIPSVPRRR